MLPIGYESQGPPSKRVKELQTHSLPKIAARMVLMGSKEVGENVEESELIEVPVEILLACVSFAKQYQMAGILSLLLHNIENGVVETCFDAIMQHAVAHDISPLATENGSLLDYETMVRHLSTEVIYTFLRRRKCRQIETT